MKIDLDWIQKKLDAEREVELVCVDSNRFLGAHTTTNKLILRQESLIVESVFDNYGILLKGELKGGASNYIHRKEFECFRIKRPAPTFEDLITEVVKAYESGLVSIVRMGRDRSRSGSLVFCKDKNSAFKVTYEDMANHGELIEYIKSLYTETFVIESVEDIARSKRKAIVELANGNTFIVDTVSDNYLIPTCSFDKLTLLVLKGATVTKQKGNK